MQVNLPLVASIFFDAPSSSNLAFPIASSIPHNDFPSELQGFFLVASDPTRFAYPCDEGSEAIDSTNWAVVAGHVPSSLVPEITYLPSADEVEEAIEVGAVFFRDTFETFLLVDPSSEEGEDLIDTFEALRGALEGYPLLDEEAYSNLENEAWEAFVLEGGMQWDVTRELRDLGVDEVTIDAIEEAWETVAAEAASKLDYVNGFEGTCSPPFEVVVLEVVVEGLTRVLVS